jgi:hypothetical protein
MHDGDTLELRYFENSPAAGWQKGFALLRK